MGQSHPSKTQAQQPQGPARRRGRGTETATYGAPLFLDAGILGSHGVPASSHIFNTLENKGSQEESMPQVGRSSWLPGSEAPTLSQHRHATTPCPWHPTRVWPLSTAGGSLMPHAEALAPALLERVLSKL